ncbi:MAG TPA: DNA polymerase domain-containing protein [Coprothermobacter proteolyticus]|nr:DNA polymerase domain-containing protein [Coprothermobacter proteolyticus]
MFYTSVKRIGNQIALRYIHNGVRDQKRIDFEPTLFVTDRKSKTHKTLKGTPVSPKKFDSISEANEFAKQMKDCDTDILHGHTDWEMLYLHEAFPEIPEFDFSLIKSYFLDIEVEARNGFPKPEEAKDPINAITVYDNNKDTFYTFSTVVDSYKSEFKGKKVMYYGASDERDLLFKFLAFWEVNHPDIITGWNVAPFDVPYLVNRIANVINEDAAKRLSPWKKIIARTSKNSFGQEIVEYTILGIEILDYLDLYKKYTFKKQESYKLGFICQEELGETKVEFDGDLNQLADEDPIKFIDYNIQDVHLVWRLDEKMQLLMLATTVAYMMRINYREIMGTVFPWTSLVTVSLLKENIVLDAYHRPTTEVAYEGAYVKDPVIGKYGWTASIDGTSLYPSMIMGFNISPETKVEVPPPELSNWFRTRLVESIIDGNVPHEVTDALERHNMCIAANGQLYRKDVHGILPRLMQFVFDGRKTIKKEMLKQKQVKVDMSAAGKDTTEIEKQIRAMDVKQQAYKILANSAYGAVGNIHFPLYDLHNAEAITLSGQAATRMIGASLSAYVTSLSGVDGDHFIYGDTDSVYINLQPICDKIGIKEATDKNIDAVCKFVDSKINDVSKKAADSYHKTLNVFRPTVDFKREKVCSGLIMVAKKRYIAYVHDSEGVRYSSPELAITGLETNRSSTPKLIRSKLEEVFKTILTKDESSVQRFVAELKDTFVKEEPEVISFPRGVNDVQQYQSRAGIYTKGCPIAVRAALLYNFHVKRLGLENKYHLIGSGDKIRFVYLKMPNVLHENVIGWIDKFPEEFNIKQCIDYDTQFEKSFLQPLQNVLDAVGWKTEKTSSLEGFFS